LLEHGALPSALSGQDCADDSRSLMLFLLTQMTWKIYGAEETLST
jgi:hypothetical protein